MSIGITIRNMLDVLGGDRVVVPGCESESAWSSTTMARFRQCNSVTVPLADALEAIPGSHVILQINSGVNFRTLSKWFVLPSIDQGCPCSSVIDYYKILRELTVAEEQEDSLDDCQLADYGFKKCDESSMIAVISPYKPEGEALDGISDIVYGPDVWEHEPELTIATF